MTEITFRQERDMARPFMPAIAWPTLALAIALPIAQVIIVGLALSGYLSYWLATPILGFISYSYYTQIHESIHENIVRNRKYNWVHTVIGWWGSLNLFYTWPILRRTHQLHHSHTNGEKDPDHALVGGSFLRLVGQLLKATIIYIIPYFLTLKFEEAIYSSKEILNKREFREHLVVMHLLQAFVLAMVVLGFGVQILFLFILPTLMGGFMLMVFFQWLPHFPFDTTDRYHNSRISEWPFADKLMYGQNIHLIHHMWPSVPFYKYRDMLEHSRDYLESKGARIEGFKPKTPRTPPRKATVIPAE